MAKIGRRGFFGRALGGFAAALGLAKTVTVYDGPWLVGNFPGAPPPARIGREYYTVTSTTGGWAGVNVGDTISIDR